MTILINDNELNRGEVLTLEVALLSFKNNLEAEGLGDDPAGQQLQEGLLKNVGYILGLLKEAQ